MSSPLRHVEQVPGLWETRKTKIILSPSPESWWSSEPAGKKDSPTHLSTTHLWLFREHSQGHSWPSVLPKPSPASTCPAGWSSRASIPQWTPPPSLTHSSCSSQNSTVSHCLTRVGRGLPWWTCGWKSICQCRAHGLDPWSRKVPLAVGQPSPWAATTESTHCNYWSPHSLEPTLCKREVNAMRSPHTTARESLLLAPMRGSLRAATKTSTAKNK